MLKGTVFLTKMRPDLVELETRNIQARVTISMCNDAGIPQAKDRWFVVTPRCDRQVQLGSMNQGRSSPMPGFEAWNIKETPVLDDKGEPIVDKKTGEIKTKRSFGGKRSFRLRLQHVEIEDAYSIGCRAQRDPNGPKPPGKTPFCSTQDGGIARRWDGKEFKEIPCEGRACYLRQYHGEGNRRMKPAKTVFNLIGRIAEDEFPALLVSVATGSDFNANEFLGMVMSTEKQWADMCNRAGVALPMSWYGLPIDMTVYEAVGDESRYPRIHFVLATDLETVFRISIEQRAAIARMGHELPPAAHRLLIPAVQEADDAEVLFPASDDDNPARSAAASLIDLAKRAKEQAARESVNPGILDDDSVSVGGEFDPNPLTGLQLDLDRADTEAWVKKIETKALAENKDESLIGAIKDLCSDRLKALT